jgi:hypothetical protein
MRLNPLLIVLAVCFLNSHPALAQTGTTLATANGFRFTENDLSPEARKLYDQREALYKRQRAAIYDNWIFRLLLQAEGAARGVLPDVVRSEALDKIANPTDAQIRTVYDANRKNVGNRTIEQVRPQIVDYLKHEAEDKALVDLDSALKTKHGYKAVKGVNDPGVQATDVIARIGSRDFLLSNFAVANGIMLHNTRANLFEQVQADLENTILDRLIEAEAKKRQLDSGSFIAAEVTNKMKDFSDYERMYLEDSLRSRLFEQYAVRFNLDAPLPIKISVSPDDDPFLGNPNAKVTVIAFVDFQCSACAAFSPLMKRVVEEFAPNARLVIRDFPLTAIHEEAMSAAIAANAARLQGKFFEMGELLYRNQGALDGASLRSYASQVGLNIQKFDSDVKSPAVLAEIRKDMSEGESYGVSGTPSVFVNGKRLHRLTTGRLREMIRDEIKQ